MYNFKKLFTNLLASKKRLLGCVIVVVFFVLYSIYTAQTIQKFEVDVVLPLTRQAELAKIYGTSPFKGIRITSPPHEEFTNTTIFITAEKSLSEENVQKMLYDFLVAYYEKRKIDPDDGEFKHLNRVIEDEQKILARLVDNYSLIRKKYPQFFPGAFGDIEAEIVKSEETILNAQKAIDLNKERQLRLDKVEILKISKSPLHFFTKDFVIKLVLVTMIALFLLVISSLLCGDGCKEKKSND